MTEPFLGQINVTAFGFPPRGYARCDGSVLPVQQNQSLFSLLGTMYGGDGRVTFGLPDLRGRVPVHRGDGLEQGVSGGAADVTLTAAEMPRHTHTLRGRREDGSTPLPNAGVFAGTPSQLYHRPQNVVGTNEEVVGEAGGSEAHDNMQPYTVLSFCIALVGMFPSRN